MRQLTEGSPFWRQRQEKEVREKGRRKAEEDAKRKREEEARAAKARKREKETEWERSRLQKLGEREERKNQATMISKITSGVVGALKGKKP